MDPPFVTNLLVPRLAIKLCNGYKKIVFNIEIIYKNYIQLTAKLLKWLEQ